MLADLFLRYGYVMVFAGAAVEGDATLLTGTFLAHRGYLQFTWVLVAAAAGTVAGNQIYFWIGHRYGRGRVSDLLGQRVFGRALRWISRSSIALAVGSRFIYGFRIAIPVACGATGMSPITFLAGDIVGSVLWAIIVGLAGYAMGQTLEYLIQDLGRYEVWIAAGILLIGLLALLRHRREWIGFLVSRTRRP